MHIELLALNRALNILSLLLFPIFSALAGCDTQEPPHSILYEKLPEDIEEQGMNTVQDALVRQESDQAAQPDQYTSPDAMPRGAGHSGTNQDFGFLDQGVLDQELNVDAFSTLVDQDVYDLDVSSDQDLLDMGDDTANTRLPWFFSIHASEVNYDLTRTGLAFNEVIELGGQGVRTDVMWYDVEPNQSITDQNKIQFYQQYFSLARSRGLEPILIFSNPPWWALELYRSAEPEQFWVALETYVRLTVLMARDDVHYYQLWNEPNHLIDGIDEADDAELIRRIGEIVRELDPTAILSVNAMANVIGWEESITRWVQGAGEVIDVIGVDHYPGTWAGFSFTDWSPADTLLNRINDPQDPWFGKMGAVMETGFSSWAILIADQTRQAMWIEESLTALRQIISSQENLAHKIVFANYYQLIDVDTEDVLQEAHFGILESTLRRKIGFNALKEQIELYDFP